MEFPELIERARREGRSTLTEAESKELLKSYGVPVVEEAVARNEDDAVAHADKTGFPVVAKGLGANLTHKTERGLVKVNLRSAEDVRLAYRDIKASAGTDWEGCLIQPLIEGKRELVAGLIRDPQFGPVVMFGLGGIFTEAIGDVVFRIAPVGSVQAERMMDEIAARKLLGPFRGEAPADRPQLLRVLMGLSALGAEHPEIAEIDINPLIVKPDGGITAVDALVVLEPEGATRGKKPMSEEDWEVRAAEMRAALDVMTHAKSIAVVGAARPKESGFPGMFGCLRNFGFPGRLYPINPNIDEINGLKAYPNLLSLPEPVDLVIVSVPGPLVPDTLRDCAASGNRNIHIFTSGFSETGEEEGIRLQEELAQIAHEGNLRVIGPNCMGLYVPSARILTWTKASKESGPLAFISQSGGNAQDFTNYTTGNYGIQFNKSFSYGNALTLDSTDFLDYLAQDDETRIITMYLEGVKDGRRLLRLVTEINKRKPIIIMKGGLTESGARAVSSHTGSMAGGAKIWEAFFRQTGAVQANSLEEMGDAALAFHHLGKTPGRRTTVFGFGGGIGVSVADSCARLGLELPALSAELTSKLRKFVPPAGAMIRNPIDAAIAFRDLDLMSGILDLLSESGEIDNFIISIPFDWLYDRDGRRIGEVASYLAQEGRHHTHGKPMVAVWRQFEPNPEIRKWAEIVEDILLPVGIPVYAGLTKAVWALARLAEYCEFQKNNV